ARRGRQGPGGACRQLRRRARHVHEPGGDRCLHEEGGSALVGAAEGGGFRAAVRLLRPPCVRGTAGLFLSPLRAQSSSLNRPRARATVAATGGGSSASFPFWRLRVSRAASAASNPALMAGRSASRDSPCLS